MLATVEVYKGLNLSTVPCSSSVNSLKCLHGISDYHHAVMQNSIILSMHVLIYDYACDYMFSVLDHNIVGVRDHITMCGYTH